jgi:integrase/recombinase XerD
MRQPMKFCLPYALWPEQDRICWEAALTKKIDLFDERITAGHLSAATRRCLKYAYGRFLAFLSAYDGSLLALPAADRLHPNIIAAYIDWQPKSCGLASRAIYLCHLQLSLRYLCPNEDWSWLSTIANRTAGQAKQRPAKYHLVTSEVLYALGLELMNTAVNLGDLTKDVCSKQALMYRDGLLIALLALIPLRLRTLAALRIGKHLVRSGDLWTLDIPAEDVKTKRPLDYPIAPELSKRIDIYLSQFRSRIPGAMMHNYLWASWRSRPLCGGAIYATVRRRTCATLGFAVNPHRFRHAAATLWSMRDPVNVRGAKDLLGHASFGTTENLYVMSQSRVAGRALARAIAAKQGPN